MLLSGCSCSCVGGSGYCICACVLGHPAVAVSLVLLSFSMCRGRAGPEKSASVLQGSRSQGTRWKASVGFRQTSAGRGFCVGMLPLVCSTPACPGLLVVVRFRAVHRCCFLGAAYLSGSLVVKLSPPCWLAAVRGAGGAFGAEGSWLVQVSCKSGCPSCFADASERGVSPRLEVGGLPARFALSKLRLLLFEARLSGYCVREGEVKGINPGFLVLGFSTRTLKSRGGSGKTSSGRGFCVGMLSLVCSTPACPGLMVVVRFSCGPPLLLFGVLLSAQQGSARR